jgi:hypothetical protein
VDLMVLLERKARSGHGLDSEGPSGALAQRVSRRAIVAGQRWVVVPRAVLRLPE